MSINSQYLIRSINNNKNITKDTHHSLSPNVRSVYNPPKPIKNNLFPKNRFINNNHNYNIKVNVINKKKEKIIEGDLNFNNTFKQQKYSNVNKPKYINNKTKNPRGMPRKSPLPIPKSYKPNGMLNFNRINSSKPYYNIRPNTKKYNKPNNIFHPQGIYSGKISTNTSKSFNSIHIKKDRSHSPLIRSGQNKGMNFGIKVNKNRIISKSPILGKSTGFSKNSGNFGISSINNGNNILKKGVKKNQVPQTNNNNINNNNNVHKKINNVNQNHPSQKRNTIISGEIYQESNQLNKMNYNINNNGPNLLNINNLKPVSNNIINNNDIINNNGNNNKGNIIKNDEKIINNNINQNNSNNNNEKKEIKINKENNNRNEEEKNMNLKNKNENLQNGSEVNNNIQKKEIIKEDENNNKLEDSKNKKNNRSQSQEPIDPLKRNEEYEINKKKEKEEINRNENKKKVIKKIKELLPYTHVGFDGEEPKENNQDNYFIFKKFAEHKDYIYMSVCDGHGVEGHFVSEFIKEVLPYYMSENLKERNILKETELVHQIITETFLIVNNMLVENESINSLFSGSTCVSVIFTPERLIVPNIGDSRAVLGRYDKKNGKYKAIDLSRDHKPTEKDEAQRIYENDGRIQPFTEDGEFVGPQRVWIKDEEVPGLAMTRSFGDRVAATVGVMSEPEIKEFNFDEDDKFMIIASDGIWEFISSQECVDMIQSYYESNDLKGCCEYLYQESSRRWLKEEEVIDDTTLILVFFE